MAKSFKTQRPATAAPEPVKPISERDFFDLTDEPIARPATASRTPAPPAAGNPPASQPALEPVSSSSSPATDYPGNRSKADNKENTSNTVNPGHTGKSGHISNPGHIDRLGVTGKPQNTGKSNHTSNADNISNTSKVGNTGNGSKPDNKEETNLPVTGSSAERNQTAREVAAASPEAAEERDVRQTFVVGSSHLDRLRDYVHARRAGGDYEYSQKQALQEALELLFGSVAPVPPRPAQARASEQRRSERIRRGRTQ